MAKRKRKMTRLLPSLGKLSNLSFVAIVCGVVTFGILAYYVVHALSYHRIGILQEHGQTFYYTNPTTGHVTAEKVIHPDQGDGGKLSCSNTCWLSAKASSTFQDAWTGPGFHVASSGVNSTNKNQRACFVIRVAPGASSAIAGISVDGTPVGQSTSVTKDFKCYWLNYTVKAGQTGLSWTIHVQSGQVQIDRVELWQGGASGKSVFVEL